MDVKAFGSIYAQTASLPYASGFAINASGTDATFAACRAIYVETSNTGVSKKLTVVLADTKAPLTFNHIRDNGLIPISIVQISGSTTIDHCYVLY
jgi:ABC-type xylose transport system substrate-binding protein